MIHTRINDLLQIKYPLFQGGMAWIADADLASSVSEAGGLGIIAAGNADGDYVRREIRKAKELTGKPFGVNIMLLSPHADEVAKVVAEENVKVVTTGAGNPSKYMELWKERGITVIPVVASKAMAKMMERSGADALIAEGGESGGHVGDTTTMVLLPMISDSVSIPVIGAGGIADEREAAASFILGAEGIQMGTAFLAAKECNIHPVYKEKIIKAGDRATMVTGKRLGHPVRSLRTSFARRYREAEYSSASDEELEKLGVGALRKAVKDGDEENGCFLSGQAAYYVNEIKSAKDIVEEIMKGCERIMREGFSKWLE